MGSTVFGHALSESENKISKKIFEVLFSLIETLNGVFEDLRRVARQKFFRILVELKSWRILKKKLLKKLLKWPRYPQKTDGR